MVKRRILRDFQSSRGRGQHGHTAHLSQLEGGLHIQRVKDVFDGDFVGLVFVNDLAESRDKFADSRRGKGSRGESLMAPHARQREFAGAGHLHHAEAGVFCPAINAQNAHVNAVYPRSRELNFHNVCR